MPKLTAQFITMLEGPIKHWLDASILGRAIEKHILGAHVISILESVDFNPHKIDDTPYGGGPGELLRIDIIVPLITRALAKNQNYSRENKRVILLDPAGKKFNQADAKRLSSYQELIFVCGRYEGIDARVHHYVDEAISVGDFVLSSGDLAAMTIFDATARMVDGVLGNFESIEQESHMNGRLESSHYTRPKDYQDFLVPDILQSGNHQQIKNARELESILKTKLLRPDLLQDNPVSSEEKKLLEKINKKNNSYPWQTCLEKKIS